MQQKRGFSIMTQYVIVTLVVAGWIQLISIRVALMPLDVALINLFEPINVVTFNQLSLLCCPAIVGWLIRKYYGYQLSLNWQQRVIFGLYNFMMGFMSKQLALFIVAHFSNFLLDLAIWCAAIFVITMVLWFMQPTFTNVESSDDHN